MEQRIIVRDGLVPEQFIDAALASVLPPDSHLWKRGSESEAGPNRIGRSGPTFLKLPEDHPTIAYMDEVIRNTTSRHYTDPVPDHSYAGVFQMLPGDQLSPHRDKNTVSPYNRKVRRRIGIVLFLNDPDGGLFQLWDENGPTDSIEPVRGRLVLFDVNAHHSVTEVGEEARRLTLGIHLASPVTKEDPPPHTRMTWLADDHQAFNP